MTAITPEFGMLSSPFHRLAPKPRVRIWKEVFVGGFFVLDEGRHCRIRYSGYETLSCAMSLLQLYKQTRREAELLFTECAPIAIDPSHAFKDYDPDNNARKVHLRSARIRRTTDELRKIPFQSKKKTLMLRVRYPFYSEAIRDRAAPVFAGTTAEYLQGVTKFLDPDRTIADFVIACHRCAHPYFESEYKESGGNPLYAKEDARISFNGCGVLNYRFDVKASTPARK